MRIQGQYSLHTEDAVGGERGLDLRDQRFVLREELLLREMLPSRERCELELWTRRVILRSYAAVTKSCSTQRVAIDPLPDERHRAKLCTNRGRARPIARRSDQAFLHAVRQHVLHSVVLSCLVEHDDRRRALAPECTTTPAMFATKLARDVPVHVTEEVR